jgi:5-hydroxyisourate hydrolase
LSGISTHVLDISRGRPAAGIAVSLEIRAGNDWTRLAAVVTDESGRAANLLPSAGSFERGAYRLLFDVASYFRAQGVETFYSEVSVIFEVRNPGEHYHVPLLLSPWGYSTYRGT